jgi:hypothetical protein
MPIGYSSRQRLVTSAPVEDDRSEFGKGFSAGISQTKALGGGLLAAIGSATGDDDLFYEGLDYYNAKMSEAAEDQAEVGRIEDIDGFDDFSSWLAYTAGNVIPSLATTVAGGGIGGFAAKQAVKKKVAKDAQKFADDKVRNLAEKALGDKVARDYTRNALSKAGMRGATAGAIVPSVGLSTGESFTRIMEETGEERAGAAFATGIVAGALDAAAPLAALKRILPKGTYQRALDDIGEKVMKDRGRFSRAMLEAGRVGGIEGLTEMTQEILQNTTVQLVEAEDNPELKDQFFSELFNETNRSLYMNAFAAGAVGGGVVGGGFGTFKKTKTEDEAEVSDREIFDEATATPEEPNERLDAARARQAEVKSKQFLDDQLRKHVEARANAKRILEEQQQPEAEQTAEPEVPQVEPEVPDVEPQTPAEPETATPLEALENQTVTYEGQEGILVRREDGFYVVQGDQETFIESGEAMSAESLGIVPTDVDLEFDNDVRYDPESNTINFRGDQFTYQRTNTNQDGEVVSVTAVTQDGQERTFRNPEVVGRVVRQIEESEQTFMPSIDLDDLPPKVQERAVDKAEAEGVELGDEISAKEAEELAKPTETDPEDLTPQVQEAVINRGIYRQPSREKTDEGDTSQKHMPYVGKTTPKSTFASDAIDNNRKLSESTTINSAGDQYTVDGDVDIAFSNHKGDPRSYNIGVKGGNRRRGKTVASLSGDRLELYQKAVIDIVNQGMPSKLVRAVQHLGYFGEKGSPQGVEGFYAQGIDLLSVSGKTLDGNQKRLRWTLLHEFGHAFDAKTNNPSENSELWDFTVALDREINDDGDIEVEFGELIGELFQNWEDSTPLGDILTYPMLMSYFYVRNAVKNDASKLEQALYTIKSEAFAQAFATFFNRPEVLKQHAPKTYDYFRSAVDAYRSEETVSDAQSGQVSGDIRAPADAGPVQVQEIGGAGRDSQSGAETEQASESVDAGRVPERAAVADDRVSDIPASPEPDAVQDAGPVEQEQQDNEVLNAEIKEKNKTLFQRVKTQLRRYLAPGGLLPESVFKLKIERDSELGAVEIDVRSMLGGYDRAVQAAYGSDIDDATQKKLNDALQNVSEIDSMGLPGDVKDAILTMRAYLDNMSEEYAQVLFDDAVRLVGDGQNEAARAKVDLIETIAGNLGQYVHRSYRVHDDPKWATKVPDEVLNRAREYLKKNGATNPQRVLNELLKDGTAYDSMESMIKESMLGAKDLSILKQRKDIAPEIRELLGEYVDPRVNFGKSATKMSRLLFNDRFLKKIKEDGEGVYLFNKDDAPTEAFTTFAPDGSSALAPLSGMKTTPEIHQAFKEALDKEQMSDWYRWVVQANGWVKFGKTVIAPTTMARNYMSAYFFTLANGHFNLDKAGQAASTFSTLVGSKDKQLEYVRKLKQLGVIYDTPYAGEMMALLDESKMELTFQNKLFDNPPAKFGKKMLFDTLPKLYQFGDDFWKIIGFENEISILMEHKGLTREEAEPLAAERIRNTYPTYSMVGKAGTWLRRFPLAGTFVSFPAEIIRTSFNMLRYLKQDLDDPDMRDVAMQRITGLSIVSGGAFALTAALRDQLDVDEEEDEAVRLLAPPWSQNSNLAYIGRKDGNLQYLDLSALDPYSYWKRPINAMLRDQPLDDAVVQATSEMLAPFFGQDIAFGALAEIWKNEKASGASVYNPSDTPVSQLADITGHMFDAVAPSLTDNVTRTMAAIDGGVTASGRRYELEDELAAFVGFRVTTLDPKISLYYKAFEFNESKRRSTDLLRSTFRGVNEVSDEELRQSFNVSSRARKEAFEKMIKIVEAVRRSGLNDSQIKQVLRSNGITAKDAKALMSGDITKYNITDSTLKSSIKRADFLVGESTAAEFQRRFRYLQSLEEE